MEKVGNTEPSLLLKVDEAARLLSLGRSTVFKMLASGELPVVKMGRAVRVRRVDVERWATGEIDPGAIDRERATA